MKDILALKYRPKKLDDLIGQEVVATSLKNAFKRKNLHHAYLLEGLIGSGKTTTARILAAMENCSNLQGIDPCGECNNCKSIFSGKSMDIKELDAASNRSVDDIRGIKADINRAGIQCNVRYIIIDEAHSLTREAAESALKMIEEPPDNVRFILCTTDAHKLKESIRSRCIPFKFKAIDWVDIFEHLKNICETEKIEFEEDGLKNIAKSSCGSIRNSLQYLEKVLSYSDGKIENAHVIKSLGVLDENIYFHLFDSISKKNVTKIYQVINKMFSFGENTSQILERLTNHLGNLLLTKTNEDNIDIFNFTDEDIKKYKYQAGCFSQEAIQSIMSILGELHRSIYFNVNAKRSLELFCIKSLQFVN